MHKVHYSSHSKRLVVVIHSHTTVQQEKKWLKAFRGSINKPGIVVSLKSTAGIRLKVVPSFHGCIVALALTNILLSLFLPLVYWWLVLTKEHLKFPHLCFESTMTKGSGTGTLMHSTNIFHVYCIFIFLLLFFSARVSCSVWARPFSTILMLSGTNFILFVIYLSRCPFSVSLNKVCRIHIFLLLLPLVSFTHLISQCPSPAATLWYWPNERREADNNQQKSTNPVTHQYQLVFVGMFPPG